MTTYAETQCRAQFDRGTHRSSVGAHLPVERQNALALEAQGGSTRARDILLETSFGLLHRIVRLSGALKQGCDYEDLMQEAALGFLRGLELYDPDRGATLGTFAGLHARSYIQRFMSNTGRTIRLPVDVLRLQQRAHLERERVGHDAPDEVIAACLGVSPPRLREVDAAHAATTISLEHVLVDDPGGGDGLILADVVDDPRQLEALDAVVRAKLVDDVAALARLDARERHVIRRTCADGVSVGEVALEMEGRQPVRDGGGISRQRVWEIKSKAVRKLRRAANRLTGRGATA